jgi:hypothetical protein
MDPGRFRRSSARESAPHPAPGWRRLAVILAVGESRSIHDAPAGRAHSQTIVQVVEVVGELSIEAADFVEDGAACHQTGRADGRIISDADRGRRVPER